MEYDIGAGTLAIGVAPGMNPSSDGCSVSLEVDDFDAAITELRAAGIEFSFGPIETAVCNMCFVKDPDGNSVGIHQAQAWAFVASVLRIRCRIYDVKKVRLSDGNWADRWRGEERDCHF